MQVRAIKSKTFKNFKITGMKTLKVLLAVIILALAVQVTQAQVISYKEHSVDGGTTIDLSVIGIDSSYSKTMLLTTGYRSWAKFDGQSNIYITWKMVGSAVPFADTVLCIIRGRFGDNTALTYPVDTLVLTEDTLGISGEQKINQSVFSPNLFFPEYEFILLEKGNNNLISGIYLSAYAKTPDAAYTRKSYLDN